MTALTSSLADVIGYLVTACQASTALQALGCQVLDGPQPTSSAGAFESVLWVGHNPMDAATGEAGSADQGFAFLDHAMTKDENGEIWCCAKHWSGDTTFSVHRTAVKAITGAVELLVRGDNTTAGFDGTGDSSMGGLVAWSEIVQVQMYQRLITGGAEAVQPFKISYFRRLTS